MNESCEHAGNLTRGRPGIGYLQFIDSCGMCHRVSQVIGRTNRSLGQFWAMRNGSSGRYDGYGNLKSATCRSY
jgi:hypothetical protein